MLTWSICDQDLILGWRLMRRKLGLGPEVLREFHFLVETKNLAQLDAAFGVVSARSGEIEALHHALNSKVKDSIFALYRDFPDPQRQTGGTILIERLVSHKRRF